MTPPHALAATPRLNVTDRIGHRVVALDKTPFTIGRGEENDLAVGGREVSRVHAEIVRDGDSYVVHDRGSRYGTFVNGELLTSHVLGDGDRIRLGRSAAVELIFLAEQEEQPGGSLVGIIRQTAALLEGLRALGAGHLLQDVLALVLDAAIEVSGAERGFIMLAAADGNLEMTLGRARGRVTLTGEPFHISRKIPEQVFGTGEALLVDDLIDEELSAEHEATIALGIRQVLCVPLRLMRYLDAPGGSEERRRIGVLYLDSRDRGALLSTTTKLGVETLAAEAAVAIENARLYREALEKARIDQELSIAADMQRALRPPGVYRGADFTIAAATRSSRSIGGDFFDYVEFGDGAVGIALGDVAGKGPPAAVLAAAVQGMFAAYASEQSPGDTLVRVNGTLGRHFVANRFATMVYLVVRPGGHLTYSIAGHNPPMLFTSSGVRRLTTGGVPLGLFLDVTFPSETIQLEPSDIIVCFSDGISEAVNRQGDFFGDDQIIDAVRANAADDAPALLEQLLAVVHDFTGEGVPQDDMTALVLRRIRYNRGDRAES